MANDDVPVVEGHDGAHNLSDTEPVVAVVARSSADEWDKIVPYDKAKGKR